MEDVDRNNLGPQVAGQASEITRLEKMVAEYRSDNRSLWKAYSYAKNAIGIAEGVFETQKHADKSGAIVMYEGEAYGKFIAECHNADEELQGMAVLIPNN